MNVCEHACLCICSCMCAFCVCMLMCVFLFIVSLSGQTAILGVEMDLTTACAGKDWYLDYKKEDRNYDGGIASRSLLTNFYSFPVCTCINSTNLPTLESYFSTDVCSMPPSMDTVSTAKEMNTTPNSLTPLDTSEVVPLNDKLLVEKEEERVIREVCFKCFFFSFSLIRALLGWCNLLKY